jgi:CheY-like chemotaxis protein
MPGMDGIQMANLIKQIIPDVPIIMLTGLGNMMKKVGEMPEAVDLLLGKPITLTEFRESLAIVVS